jgi:hypothetical protein
MKVIYRHCEPNQGLVELKAKIYREVSELSVDAEEIKRRFKGEKQDFKTASHVLTEYDQPFWIVS